MLVVLGAVVVVVVVVVGMGMGIGDAAWYKLGFKLRLGLTLLLPVSRMDEEENEAEGSCPCAMSGVTPSVTPRILCSRLLSTFIYYELLVLESDLQFNFLSPLFLLKKEKSKKNSRTFIPFLV